jgi:Carboxypeptidase regulatory-like domain
MKKNNKKLLLLLFIFPFAFLAKANTGKSESPLQGYVTDAITKKPVPGVLVSASAQGANASREVTTDADGYFSFVQLPSTQVTVQFDKKGYQPVKKTGVVVEEKIPVKMNVEFLPDDMDTDAGNSEYPLLRMLHLN